jgi:hypothetical protein
MNLQSFCRKGSGFNTYLTKPFQFDDALVATDGAIIVSIKNDKTPSRDTAPSSTVDELAEITKLKQQTYRRNAYALPSKKNVTFALALWCLNTHYATAVMVRAKYTYVNGLFTCAV